LSRSGDASGGSTCRSIGAIVDLNFASEEDTWRALGRRNHLEYVDPVTLDLKRETLDWCRSSSFFSHYHLLPLGMRKTA